jgi:ABC-type hemin transport system substrate-binding protein
MPDHACLRIGGLSKGADEMIELAGGHAKAVFRRFKDVPGCAGMEE